MFCLKFRIIYLNGVPETPVLRISYCVLINPVYNIIVDEVMVHRLKVQAISKESYEVIGFQVVRGGARDV